MAFVDPSNDRPQQGGEAAFRGHRVIDEQHRTIGRVTDVIFADDGSPRWAVVSPGMFRGEHVMPLQDCYVSTQGDVVAPYDKHVIVKAPKVNETLATGVVRLARLVPQNAEAGKQNAVLGVTITRIGADAGWAAEVARVESLRQELMNSTSWRITRPLRAS